MLEIKGKYTKAHIFTDIIEPECINQINTMINHPAFTEPVAIMPDCLTDDTDILTSQGFKKITDLQEDDFIAAISMPERKVKFEKPSSIIKRPLKPNEQIIELYSEALKTKIRMSKKHRTALVQDLGAIAVDLPKELRIRDFIWSGDGTNSTSPYSDDELRLIAWIVGDGNIKITHNSKSDNQRIRFGFTKKRKIDRIKELCQRLAIYPAITTDNKQTTIYINTIQSRNLIKQVGLTKEYPKSLISQCNKKQAKIFLEEAIQVDGDYEAFINGRGMRFNSSKRSDLNFLASIASINGFTCYEAETQYISNLTEKETIKYYLQITEEPSIKEWRSGLHNKKITKEIINDYKGNLVCITCSTGFFIARQNRRTFITGNCHAGKGSVIGFTMPITEMIVPACVGVDIGCGMLGVKIEKPKTMDLKELDITIRKRIPFGFAVRQRSGITHSLERDNKFFSTVQSSLDQMWLSLKEKFKIKVPRPPQITHEWYSHKCAEIGQDFQRAQMSIGTLGGGNHFIELGISSLDENHLWVIVHSGSRQLGKNICDYHQNIAIKLQDNATKGDYEAQIEHIKKTSHTRDIQKKIQKLRASRSITTGIKQSGLESLTGREMYDYLYDMVFAQEYATLNRSAIMTDILDIIVPKVKIPTRDKPRLMRADRITGSILEQIETVHNYIHPKDLIIRKGAVAAYPEKIIIPFNMQEGTWICMGRGDPIWNYSAPHGAGRIMSRTQAKKDLKQEDANTAMEGIYTSCIPLDEAPGAYKDPSKIKQEIGPTAGLLESVRPIMNMKAK